MDKKQLDGLINTARYGTSGLIAAKMVLPYLEYCRESMFSEIKISIDKLAMAIVNHINEINKVSVDIRQSTNDACFDYVAKSIEKYISKDINTTKELRIGQVLDQIKDGQEYQKLGYSIKRHEDYVIIKNPCGIPLCEFQSCLLTTDEWKLIPSEPVKVDFITTYKHYINTVDPHIKSILTNIVYDTIDNPLCNCSNEEIDNQWIILD